MIHMTIFGKRVSSPSLGHFAQAIVDASQQYKNVSITEPNIDMKPDAVIYASRSNDYFADAVSVARQFAVPLLVVSTDVKSQLVKYRDQADIHYYSNTSLHTIDFMKDIEAFWAQHQEWQIASFSEWHQQSKKGMSGTAIAIAESISYDTHNIEMIRNDDRAQKERNIPETAQAYAIHNITFANHNDTARRVFSLTTVGRDAYAMGAIEIALKLTKRKDH